MKQGRTWLDMLKNFTVDQKLFFAAFPDKIHEVLKLQMPTDSALVKSETSRGCLVLIQANLTAR